MASNKKKLNKWLEEHDSEDYCKYCIYGSECKGMTGGPDGLIEPLCCSVSIVELLDIGAILDNLDEE